MRRLITAAVLVALAPTALSARERVPAATPAGDAIDCLQLRQIRETRVRDDQTIDFYTLGGKVYRNTLPYSCPSLGFEQRYAYETSLDRLCSVDTITVLMAPPLTRGATCGLGKFQPVTLAKTR